MDKAVVLFVEGDTEEEFFHKLKDNIKTLCKNEKFSVKKLEIKNVQGIGNYKNQVKHKFQNEILKKHPNLNWVVFLCHDTDVDDYASKPIINWPKVKDELIKCGAKKVIEIKAIKMIEDWFLIDLEGINGYLKLSPQTTCTGKDGYEKMKNLFKKKDRVYVKGRKTTGLVDALDIKKIMCTVCKQIGPLCKELGVNCKNINKNK